MAPAARPHTLSSSRSVSLSNQSSRSDSPALSVPAEPSGGTKKKITPLSDYELEIVEKLKIDLNLTRVNAAPKNAREFYKCYQACSAALLAAETWTSPPRSPTVDDVVVIFIGKTTWYQKWVPSFRSVEEFPEMKAWLEGDDTIQVWDNPRVKHSMSSVAAWCVKQTKEMKKKAAGKTSGSKKRT